MMHDYKDTIKLYNVISTETNYNEIMGRDIFLSHSFIH